ncbi:hypothetical protein Tco_0842431 [Tanacetum coccineum]|uniref:Uncharacterized protein n=1 Tax=Tanacetum coccineum TaxID=301880 RepID=A0ABQ5B0Z1_9ASTR
MSRVFPEQLNVDRREILLMQECPNEVYVLGNYQLKMWKMGFSVNSVDHRERFPFQSVIVLSMKDLSSHLVGSRLARRYSTLESLDFGLSQHWSYLVDGLEDYSDTAQ